MNRRTVVIGLVVIVVGIASFVGGAFGVLSSITIGTNFTQPNPGEYLSAEIKLNTTSGLAVASPAAAGGIINAQDLGVVNSTNIGTYAIPYNSTGVGTEIYKSLIGDYYYVAFSSTQPHTTIVATPHRGTLVAYGLLVFVGIVCVIVGIVVAIIGVFQKRQRPVQGQN